MRRARTVLVAPLLGAALAGASLTGCSGTPQEEYCAEVEDRSEALGAVTAPADLLEALPELEGLADAAPRDISDAWTIVVQRVDDLAEALEAADVDPGTYDAQDPPEGLGEQEQQEIVSAAQGLVDRETLRAIGEVEQHALDVCGVRLGL